MEMLSNSRQLRWLSCSFMLGLVTPCSLACLSNPSAETLQHLSLLDHQLGMCGREPLGASGLKKRNQPNVVQVPSSRHRSWIVCPTSTRWLWISPT